MFLELIFRDNFLRRHFFENLIPMKSVQEHLRQLLQMVPTSKMLQLTLCIDALFNILSKVQINHVHDVSQKFTLLSPNSFTSN